MRLRWSRIISSLVLSLSFGALASVSVFAAAGVDSKSDNYQAANTVFGAGGVQSCSGEFCSEQSVGETAVGDSSGTNYGIKAGASFNKDALLEVSVDGGMKDLGLQADDATSADSIGMSVRSYLSSGYVVQLLGSPPKINGHIINNMATPTASQAGVEQFGVNLVANTTPLVGSDAVQVPDNTFSYGTVKPGYDSLNLFKFNENDIIAQSNSSTGQTNYTLSFIMNIAPNTPAGLYVTHLQVLVVPTY